MNQNELICNEAPKLSFEEALQNFLKIVQGVSDEHMNRVHPGYPSTIQYRIQPGKRYVKIVKYETPKEGKVDQYTSGESVHCFVDSTNGDILKAASWKAPAKHARGNIFEPDGGRSGIDHYGGRYLR